MTGVKLLRFVAGLFFATTLQTLGLRVDPRFLDAIDLFLILLVYHSLDSTPASSSVGGSVGGLAQDALSGGLFGLHGFAGTVVAYASSRLQQRMVLQQPLQVGFLFSLAAALQLVLLAALEFLLIRDGELPGLSTLAMRMVFSGLLGTLLFMLAERARLWLAQWRARRGRRLRI